MRILFAGGGTGGHVFPAIAVAEELLARDRQTRMLFVGSKRGLEARIIPARGFDFEAVEAGALKGLSLADQFSTLMAVPRRIRMAWRIVHRFFPHVVVGIGGYASGPVVLAAALQGKPTLILEQNCIPGFTNRILAYFVHCAAVNFEESLRFFPGNALVTGNPVRDEFFGLHSAVSGGPFTILIVGGSQGSHAINQAMMEALEGWPGSRQEMRFIHQTGERDFEAVRDAYARKQWAADVRPFFDDMPSQIGRAHLVISRSGASALAEIAAAGRPSILIPFPQAADDHQRKNAELFQAQGACRLIEQQDLKGGSLVKTVVSLIQNPPALGTMSQAARSLARRAASRKIADLIEQFAP